MDDDFNTALALSDLYGFFKTVKAEIAAGDEKAGADINQIKQTYSLLGLFKSDAKTFVDKYGVKEDEVPKEIKEKAEKMQQARLRKDYAEADALRAEITSSGYNVQISKDGVKITKA